MGTLKTQPGEPRIIIAFPPRRDKDTPRNEPEEILELENNCPLTPDELRFVAMISPKLIRQIVVRKIIGTSMPAGIVNSMVAGTRLQGHILEGDIACVIRMANALEKRTKEVNCPPYEDLLNGRMTHHAQSCPECAEDLAGIKAGIPDFPTE